VNAERPTKRPPDAIEGVPFVTAKAWAVVDGRTGKLLGGDAESQPLEMASTTKIMTALLVVRSARDVPRIYDETVTFSERADRTPGSTSGVHAGEMLSVRELLYGLLLPSGNDAAVAFAEHFGGRFSSGVIGPDTEKSPKRKDPLDGFVAEMNRVASELGLNETRFVNPHGLPVTEHHSSARDLARLAMEALKDPVFAATVVTPRRGCTLIDGQGKSRNVVWTNTNRLLDTEGYDGVKTGTTTAAGNCLVASGRHGDDRLIVVLLGSSASDGRYADARNLFRWGWQRLRHRESEAAAPLRAK
jgi:D-alanyl-D-alanine carboxypeptidase (penicillin-binding protein 5/6)